MSIKTALATRLLAVSGVTDIIGTGDDAMLFQGWADQDATYPYMTFVQISSEGVHHLASASGLGHPLFQIDIWSDATATRESLAEAVRTALDGFSGTVSGEDIRSIRLLDRGRDTQETAEIGGEELPVYRTSIDIEIWHTESVPTF